jgi:tetratricopeptide (TPR) repeat protein
MEPKDILTLTISALALLVASGTGIYTIIHGNYEQKRVILGQLNDVLDHISLLDVDRAKLYHEYSEKNDLFYFQNSFVPTLNNRLETLLEQAMYLASQESVGGLVPSPLLTIIAAANADIGRIDLAKEYHQKAIAVAKDNLYFQALATRSYAYFLFLQHDFEGGRERFRTAIKLFKGNESTTRSQRGETYLIWAKVERDVAGAQQPSQELFERAKSEYSEIDIDYLRQRMLNYATAEYKQDSPHKNL